MQITAPAKINLNLRVGPVAANGFHTLVTWMCTVNLCDTIKFEPASSTRLTCNDPSLPCDEQNLVLRAVRMMQQEADGIVDSPTDLAITLHKSIPTGAGLGGGSSDAAATLGFLNDCWQLKVSLEDVHNLAARLGSDVPFFLYGPSAVCAGRGEVVQPTLTPKPRAAVIFLPRIALPTPAVYTKFDELKLGGSDDWADRPNWVHWASLSANSLLPLLQNDLEPAAFAIEPSLGNLRTNIEQSLGRPVRMSGSGSSLFTLFDDMDEARRGAASVTAAVKCIAVELAPREIAS